MKSVFLTRRGVSLALLTGLLVMGSGCKKQPAEQAAAPAPQQAAPAPVPPPRDDQQIGSDVQAKITGESALTGQDIQVGVANGVVTLNGKVIPATVRAEDERYVITMGREVTIGKGEQPAALVLPDHRIGHEEIVEARACEHL